MKSWIKSALLGAFFIASMAAPARAEVVTIHNDVGGVISEYIQKFIWLNNDGDDVHIDGDCMSACTLILGIVDRDRICVEPNAVLSFHSAAETGGLYSRGGTAFMRRIYPPDVLRVIAHHGWDFRSPHPKLIPISGKELHTIVRPCSD